MTTLISILEFPEQTVSPTLRTPLQELIGHVSVVIAADWIFTGDQVITASWDRTAILFDAETGENISTLTGWCNCEYHENVSVAGVDVVITCLTLNLFILENIFTVQGTQ